MRLFQPEVDIYLKHLEQNYHAMQNMVGDAKVMAVIKANAYGHGIIPVAKTLSDAGIHGFCVALESEAEELINAGIRTPILHLGRISKDSFELYNSGQVRCTINSAKDVIALKRFINQNKLVIAHLKIDTGMGRLGVQFREAESIMKALANVPAIRIESVYSHFSTAEESDTQYRGWQLQRFQKVVKMANEILPETKYFHIANSAGILNCTDSHFNMVRPGISLYGVSSLGKFHEKLLPVMRMKAPVVLVKNVKSGESVGYSRLFIAKKDENIALLQAGYADGIPVEFSNSGSVEINGVFLPIIGKVSMDLVAIKCQDANISEGDEAIFWGSKNENLKVETLAKQYNIIPYEFLTGVSSRVNRKLINE